MTETDHGKTAAPSNRRERALWIAIGALAIWNLWLGSQVSEVNVQAIIIAADDARRALNRANEAYYRAVDSR